MDQRNKEEHHNLENKDDFVTLLVGGLVNGMVVLISGPVVDKLLDKKR